MTVLLLNYEYPPLGGGAANATLFMAKALVKLGHRAVVVTSALGRASGRTEENNIVVYHLRTGRVLRDRSTVYEVGRYLLASLIHAPDIATKEGCQGTIAFFTLPSAWPARKLLRKHGLPYVISLAGGDVPGHVPELERLHALTKPWRRAALRDARGIVANSEGLAATCRVADPFPVAIIPNGVDNDLFHPAEDLDSRERSVLKLLFVGRVHREKNLGVVFEQLATLPKAARERYRLMVVGDGAQRSELVARAEQLGLTAQIDWLGWQEKDAMPALYRRADAFVIPSLYEGMSNAALEAMASGLPVFASDVPGNRAVVTEDETGALFPLDRPEKLGAALEKFALDREWGRNLGKAARRRTESDLSWEKTAQQYLEFLRPISVPNTD